MADMALQDLAMMLLTSEIGEICPDLMACARADCSIESAFECGTPRELEAIVLSLISKTARAPDKMMQRAHCVAAGYVWKRFYPKLGNAANDGQAA